MKRKTAKFGIFGTTESGADYLVTARDINGNPFMTYEAAVDRMNDYENRANLFIRSL